MTDAKIDDEDRDETLAQAEAWDAREEWIRGETPIRVPDAAPIAVVHPNYVGTALIHPKDLYTYTVNGWTRFVNLRIVQ